MIFISMHSHIYQSLHIFAYLHDFHSLSSLNKLPWKCCQSGGTYVRERRQLKTPLRLGNKHKADEILREDLKSLQLNFHLSTQRK